MLARTVVAAAALQQHDLQQQNRGAIMRSILLIDIGLSRSDRAIVLGPIPALNAGAPLGIDCEGLR